MPKCPICGAEGELIKSWILKPKSRPKGIKIGLYRCSNGHYFRKKLEE